MATNLEKLRAKKAANQKKEADLTTSFTIDEGKEVPPIEDSKPISPIKSIDNSKDSSANKDATIIVDEVKTISEKEPKTIGSTSVSEEAKNPVKANNQNQEKANTKSTDAAASPERNLGLRLASEEDKRYLNMAPLSRSMTKKAFFIELMETEINNIESIDVKDTEVENFRNSSLQTAAITIAVPETLITQIKEYSAKHMMKYQRYVAYVIHKARMNDENWVD